MTIGRGSQCHGRLWRSTVPYRAEPGREEERPISPNHTLFITGVQTVGTSQKFIYGYTQPGTQVTMELQYYRWLSGNCHAVFKCGHSNRHIDIRVGVRAASPEVKNIQSSLFLEIPPRIVNLASIRQTTQPPELGIERLTLKNTMLSCNISA